MWVSLPLDGASTTASSPSSVSTSEEFRVTYTLADFHTGRAPVRRPNSVGFARRACSAGFDAKADPSRPLRPCNGAAAAGPTCGVRRGAARTLVSDTTREKRREAVRSGYGAPSSTRVDVRRAEHASG